MRRRFQFTFSCLVFVFVSLPTFAFTKEEFKPLAEKICRDASKEDLAPNLADALWGGCLEATNFTEMKQKAKSWVLYCHRAIIDEGRRLDKDGFDTRTEEVMNPIRNSIYDICDPKQYRIEDIVKCFEGRYLPKKGALGKVKAMDILNQCTAEYDEVVRKSRAEIAKCGKIIRDWETDCGPDSPAPAKKKSNTAAKPKATSAPVTTPAPTNQSTK